MQASPEINRGHMHLRSQLRSPKLLSLFDYWSEKRGGQPFILRSQLQPAEITALLPLIFILDVEQAPPRYRIRLMGTQIAARFGGDHTGRYMDELDFGAIKTQVLAGYDRVVDRAEPDWAFAEFTQQGRGLVQAERLALPMSAGGSTVDQILGVVVHVPLEERGIPGRYKNALRPTGGIAFGKATASD